MITLTLLYASLLSLIATAKPYDGFPFADQLPPVARVNESYNFQLSNETYRSDSGSVSYSISDAPSWLQFDSDLRILSGTPTDINGTSTSEEITFLLSGVDSTGNSYVSTEKLLVSSEIGPIASTEYTVLSQLTNFGQTNGLDSLVLTPGEIFNVTFDQKTFYSNSSQDPIVAYYGLSSDHSPLPNWLFFDSANLRFSGVAPAVNSDIAPGFQYNFIFIATDYEGYTGTTVDFGIIVGAHELTTSSKEVININGTEGSTINYSVPLDSIYADGSKISVDEISSIKLSGNPDWLSLSNYTLVGTVPVGFNQDNASDFTVTIQDQYTNSVVLEFKIQSIDSLFAVSSFISSNATRGDFFQYYFLPTDFTDYEETEISLTIENAHWLTYYPSNLTLNGIAPSDFQSAEITITAKTSSREDELSFNIYGVDKISSTTTSTTTSSSTASTTSVTASTAIPTAFETATPSSSAAAGGASTQKKSNHALAIGLGAGLGGGLALLILLLLLFFFCVRRKSSAANDEEKQVPAPTPKVPAHIPNSRDPISPDTSGTEYEDLEDEEGDATRLGALNVLKLDEKNFADDDDNHSSATVDATEEHLDSSVYQDAILAASTDQLLNDSKPKTRKSWRNTLATNGTFRDSMTSLNTVATTDLLTIKLAEGNELAKDPKKSTLNNRDSVFFGDKRESNLQRLDSDGNIVANLRPNRLTNTNLNILKEESTHLNTSSPESNRSYGSAMEGEAFYPVGDYELDEDQTLKWEIAGGDVGRKNSKAQLKQFTGRSKSVVVDDKDFSVSVERED
ncbi:hypothetical protein WICPIJ_006585 [Wickerhamomyces pijperi]|uniref:Dystroglycan-type cadherin-like domain-containing protein n=1 Tax=Wickerhamomyces pijperi TaxID=599730 RepID=A0A9P8TK35_WICPI|nr:hypothetical protein WICPIJ_006585 [Wickerhamomyces pijperi]